MRSSNLEYSEKLDHLRFAACLMVMLFHLMHPFYTWLSGNNSYRLVPNPLSIFVIDGHTGVGLFLVLSGFLFARICRKGAFSAKNFYLNRFLRIYPLYIFVLLVAIHFGRPEHPWMPFLYSMLMQQAQACALHVEGLEHLWSLAVELQFYLVFPILLWLFRCRHGISLLLLLMFIDVMTLLTLFTTQGDFLSIAYGCIVGRINQCLAGMIAGFTLEEYQDRLRHPAVFPLLLLGWAAILMFFHAQGGMVFGTRHPMWIFFPTLEGFCWSAIVASYLSCNWNLPGRLSKVLAYGGALSFSLYVWHFYITLVLYRVAVPILKYPGPQLSWLSDLQHAAQQFPFAAAMLFVLLVIFPINLLVSMISYHFIEVPFFTLRRRYIFPEGESADKQRVQPSPGSYFADLRAALWLPLKVAASVIGAFLFVALCGESICYMTGTDISAYLQPDEKLGFRLMPGKRIKWTAEGFSNDLISTAGFRDVEHAEKKAPGVKRILVLGTSMTEGLQVPLEKVAARRLEYMLNTSEGRKFEVINGSCSCYSLGQLALLYEQLADKYHPDEVVVAYTYGSAESTIRNAQDFSCLCRPYFYLRNGVLEQDSSFLPPAAYCSIMRFIYQHSRFARLISYQRELAFVTNKDFGFLQGVLWSAWRTAFCRKVNYEQQDCAQVRDAVISYLNKIIRLRGAHLTVCALPGFTADEHKGLQEIKRLGFQQDFSVSDVNPAFYKIGMAGYCKFHFSELGNEVIAKTLCEFLQNHESGSVPTVGDTKIGSKSLPI